MFRSLYARLMTLFMAVLLIAMAFLSVLLYQRIRADKIDTRLDALTTQAYDVAYLTAQRGVFRSPVTDAYLMWKIGEIMSEYDAGVFIIDRNKNLIPIGDDTMEIAYDYIVGEETMALLGRVVSGEEVKVRTIQKETGNPIFTVGVPYVYEGEMLGAVFIHTTAQNVESSYKEVIGHVAQAMLLSLAIGSVLLLVVCQFITRPLRAMAQAADRFARGDFEQRVPVDSRDEVGRLAESFNSMAEDLDRLEQTRREFVANVSHELRSPLTSMQGFLGGMLDGTVPESERDHYTQIVLDETKRLSKLITTLLDLSHIESGQKPLQRSQFDVNEMIARALLRQEARINERGLDVEVDFDEDTCLVNADLDRIEQVVINLLDNAVKFAKENGVIKLGTRLEKGVATVYVADDGPGIAPDDLKCVFERFYTVDKAHTKGNGTGLGLAIAKKIIEQHGQKISVSSTLGQGARFEFTLEGA